MKRLALNEYSKLDSYEPAHVGPHAGGVGCPTSGRSQGGDMSDIEFLLKVHEFGVEHNLPKLADAAAASVSQVTGKTLLAAWVEHEQSKPVVTERAVSHVRPRQTVSLYPIKRRG